VAHRLAALSSKGVRQAGRRSRTYWRKFALTSCVSEASSRSEVTT